MPSSPVNIGRRKWLKRGLGATLAVGVGVVIDTFWIEPHWLDVVERELPIKNLPSRWVIGETGLLKLLRGLAG